MKNRISPLPHPSLTNFETTCCASLLTEQYKQQVITLAWNSAKVHTHRHPDILTQNVKACLKPCCAFTLSSWRCFANSESGRSSFLAPLKYSSQHWVITLQQITRVKKEEDIVCTVHELSLSWALLAAVQIPVWSLHHLWEPQQLQVAQFLWNSGKKEEGFDLGVYEKKRGGRWYFVVFVPLWPWSVRSACVGCIWLGRSVPANTKRPTWNNNKRHMDQERSMKPWEAPNSCSFQHENRKQ